MLILVTLFLNGHSLTFILVKENSMLNIADKIHMILFLPCFLWCFRAIFLDENSQMWHFVGKW